jgi:hypothetical protein
MAVRSGVPGHDQGAAAIRLRLGDRDWDWATIGPYEVICSACGDDPALNYNEVPPEIQDIRGNHVTLHEAQEALAKHTGQT